LHLERSTVVKAVQSLNNELPKVVKAVHPLRETVWRALQLLKTEASIVVKAESLEKVIAVTLVQLEKHEL